MINVLVAKQYRKIKQYRKMNDTPEVLIIEGNLGGGKTALGIRLLDDLYTSQEETVYSNVELKTENFKLLKEYEYLQRISYASFLNFKFNSICFIDEIHKNFFVRDTHGKNQSKSIQSLQEQRKGGYKLIGTCKSIDLLDFRFNDLISEIIRAYGNLEKIIENGNIEEIGMNVITPFSTMLNKKNYEFLYLYEYRQYNSIDNESYPTGKFFVYDIRNSFELYHTYQKIQKQEFLNNFFEKIKPMQNGK